MKISLQDGLSQDFPVKESSTLKKFSVRQFTTLLPIAEIVHQKDNWVQKLQIEANSSPNRQATVQPTERAIHHCSPQNSSPLGNFPEKINLINSPQNKSP
jgi:hypothetical protein